VEIRNCDLMQAPFTKRCYDQQRNEMQCLDLVLQSFIPRREFQVSERKYTGTLGPASIIMYNKLMKPTSELESSAEDGCQQRKLHLS